MVIVVVGALLDGTRPARIVESVAGRAAALGSSVEVVGVVPGDATGDRRLLRLAARGIGHAAVLRSIAAALDPADLELALRYLPDVAAIVLVEPAGDLIEPAAAAAAWSGAGLVVVTDGPADAADAAPAALVLAPPRADPDEAFAGVVATLAQRLEAGVNSAEAWRATLDGLGIAAVG